VLILAASIGAAFSGAILFAYYDYRLDADEATIQQYTRGFDQRLSTAIAIIDAERDKAKDSVRSELEPLQKIAASGETVAKLLEKVEPSTWFVATTGEDGSPSVGSAFVVFSDGDSSFLVTSYATVAAATHQPGPKIELRKGDEHLDAKLETSEPAKDLALLSVRRGNLKRLAWADGEPSIGERVFAISGLGSTGASASQGLVSDVSNVGLQHDAPVGVQFQGGPLVNSSGEVVGVASRAYRPLGFAADAVWFAPAIRSTCERLLKCP
jgi:S1-C subfamily serine protease